MRIMIVVFIATIAVLTVYADDIPNSFDPAGGNTNNSKGLFEDSYTRGTILDIRWASDGSYLTLSSSLGDWQYSAKDWTIEPELDVASAFPLSPKDHLDSFANEYSVTVGDIGLILWYGNNGDEIADIFTTDAFSPYITVSNIKPVAFSQENAHLIVTTYLAEEDKNQLYVLDIADQGQMSVAVSWDVETIFGQPLGIYSDDDKYLILYVENGSILAIFDADTRHYFGDIMPGGLIQSVDTSRETQKVAVIDSSYRLIAYALPYGDVNHTVLLNPDDWDINSSILQYSPDGRYLAVIHSGGGFVYETTTWNKIYKFEGFRQSDFDEFCEVSECTS